MKDKHIQIKSDTELLKFIYTEVEKKLNVNKTLFNTILLTKFIVYFGLSVICYISLYQIENPILFVFSYIFFGFISLLFAFNFSHDFSHNTIFKSKKWNNFCFILIYTLVGAHGEAWKKRHIHSHHFAPNVEDYDSDLRITKLIRVIPESQYLWYHRFQYLYAPLLYTTYSLFWVFIKDFVILYSRDEFAENKNFRYHLSFWTQKLFYLLYLLILPLLFSSLPWYIVLIGFLLMHLAQSIFLLFTFFMTHHVETTAYPTTDKDGIINASWLMNQIQSSNDMHPFSKTANFILGGFNNHIAHHLFPHYHHIYYPELNRILYQILNDRKITPNQTTYWGGIISHLRLLKRMGVDESESMNVA